jgi:hypothetical protein
MRNLGDFLRFVEQFGRVSLRSRLYGGEGGILIAPFPRPQQKRENCYQYPVFMRIAAFRQFRQLQSLTTPRSLQIAILL